MSSYHWVVSQKLLPWLTKKFSCSPSNKNESLISDRTRRTTSKKNFQSSSILTLNMINLPTTAIWKSPRIKNIQNWNLTKLLLSEFVCLSSCCCLNDFRKDEKEKEEEKSGMNFSVVRWNFFFWVAAKFILFSTSVLNSPNLGSQK